MNARTLHLTAGLCLFLVTDASAAVHYVDLNSAAPTPPYTNWATAATNIQDAVDASTNGDQILVTNGVYQTGGRLTSDGITNRLAATNAVNIQSVNGSSVTMIDGGKVRRCAYLADGVVLTGFTLTNGNSANGGGVFCISTNVLISNCLFINNTAGSGGGAYSGTLTNCTLTGNTCPGTGGNGAGASGCILNNCMLTGNVTGMTFPNGTGATSGAGANNCTLNNCTLSGNKAYGAGAIGGGAYNSILNGFTLANGYADYGGGGAYSCALTNCTVSGNSSGYGGGGV